MIRVKLEGNHLRSQDYPNLQMYQLAQKDFGLQKLFNIQSRIHIPIINFNMPIFNIF